MTSVNKRLGRAIAEFRRTAGLTQETLAFDCDLHPTYVSQLERGLKSPTVRTLFRLAKALQVAPSEIVRAAERKQRRRA